MIALGLNIVVSTLLFSCFRLFQFNVRLEDAVVINYIVAGTLAVLMAGPRMRWAVCPSRAHSRGWSWECRFSTCSTRSGSARNSGARGGGHRDQDVDGVADERVHVARPDRPVHLAESHRRVLAFPAVWLASSPGRARTTRSSIPRMTGSM